MSEALEAGGRGWLREALSSVAQLADTARAMLGGMRERAALRREFGALRDRGELERTLTDSGIAPSDVSRLMRAHPHTPQQLAAMMRRLGIDRGVLPRTAVVGEALREMEWRCGACADWRKCRHWLASADAPESYRSFCPNAEALDALRCGGSGAAEKPCGILAALQQADANDDA